MQNGSSWIREAQREKHPCGHSNRLPDAVRLRYGKNGVGDARGLDRGANLMHADDRRAVEDCRRHRRQAGVLARVEWGIASAEERRERVTEKRFAAQAREQRPAELEEFGLTVEQHVILAESLAEAVAGIEHNLIRLRFRPACAAARLAANPSRTVASNASGASCGCVRHASGRPRVCDRTTPAPNSAQTCAMPGSQVNPLTSLTISAPAWSAARAVAAL